MDHGKKEKKKKKGSYCNLILVHEILKRIVQDINSHQEFVPLNILKGYIA